MLNKIFTETHSSWTFNKHDFVCLISLDDDNKPTHRQGQFIVSVIIVYRKVHIPFPKYTYKHSPAVIKSLAKTTHVHHIIFSNSNSENSQTFTIFIRCYLKNLSKFIKHHHKNECFEPETTTNTQNKLPLNYKSLTLEIEIIFFRSEK